uniref:Putative ovule protein n=2 Tax=Solanum TaxID=4107 RepID=A0A0V0GS45_SOLCH
MFAFSGSMASESMKENQPKIALLCHKLAIFSVAVAGGVFALSSLLSFYNIEMVDASGNPITGA